ncbi:MAG: translation initiation factor IF-2 subunit alpha, partial [Candidatus Methanospirareceae archaeon]
VEERFADEIYNVAVANVKLPTVHITGYVELQCPLPNGVEVIKEALRKAREVKLKDKGNIEISYIGAPRYRIGVTAANYKDAENLLSEAANAAIEVLKRNEGYGKFYRNLPS